MAFAVEAVWFRNIDVVGSSGVAVVPPRLFGLDLAVGTGLEYPRVAFGVLCVVVATAVAPFVAWLRRSRLGSGKCSLCGPMRVGAAAGVNVVRV